MKCQLIITLIVGNEPKFLLEAIINTTFDAMSTKPKIYILLSSKVHIILKIQHTKKYDNISNLFLLQHMYNNIEDTT